MNSPSGAQGALARFVETAGQLYSLPAVAIEVLDLTNNPQVDVRKLKECIQNDPALTTRILRTVNSSLFGLSQEVSDLNQALALLGIKPLKMLVLGFSLPENLLAGVESDALNNYWRHTLTKAVAARELAETLWRRGGDEALIAGLLQDIGMLVLLQQLGPAYAEFVQSVWLSGADIAELEMGTLGFDHAVLSARLLQRWGLPPGLVHDIGQPFNAEQLAALPASASPIPKILHLAELLTRLLVDGRTDLLAEVLELSRRYRHAPAAELDAIVPRLQAKVEQLADALALDLPAQRDYLEVLAQAHAQLAEVAREVTGELLRGAATQLPSPVSEGLRDAVQQLAGASPSSSQTAATRATAASLAKSSAATSGTAAAAEGAEQVTGTSTQFQACDPGLTARVAEAVERCRQQRCPLSVILVEIDRYAELVVTLGLTEANRLVRLVERWAISLCELAEDVLPAADARFALLLPDCERHQAVELGNELLRGIRKWSGDRAGRGDQTLQISLGVATLSMPPKNYPADELIEAATRCLFGAQTCGGNGLKSIGIY